MSEEKHYEIALNRIPGVGHATIKQLISRIGSPEQVFRSEKRFLIKVPGVTPHVADEIIRHSSFQEAEDILKTCEKDQIAVLHFTDNNYPARLKEIYDSPSILYFKGNLSNLGGRCVAVVGTRKATSYGKEITKKIIEGLRTYGATMVSGLAYGIDIEAHRASLRNDLPNYGVLASGLKVIYPKDHIKTAEEMMTKGGILSENPPLTKPDARLFPARNRIIAALSEATIVVEAAKKGGALITSNIAYSYNKPVFAIPGNLSSALSEGTNSLIKQQKAIIYTNPKDLAYHLNWEEGVNAKKEIDMNTLTLSTEERVVINTIKNCPDGLAIDDISWKSQVQLNKLASVLLNLEFMGLVKLKPGKKYILTL